MIPFIDNNVPNYEALCEMPLPVLQNTEIEARGIKIDMHLLTDADSVPDGKITAFFADGSGCNIYKVKDGKVTDSLAHDIGEVSTLMDMGYLYWSPLPDWYKFWSDH